MARLLQKIYYKNSGKLRRRCLMFAGNSVTYLGDNWIYLGNDGRLIYIAAYVGGSIPVMLITVIAEDIGCEWEK